MNIPTYDRRARKWHFTHQHRGGFRLFPVSSEEQVVHRSMVLDDPGASTRDGLKKWWKRCLAADVPEMAPAMEWIGNYLDESQILAVNSNVPDAATGHLLAFGAAIGNRVRTINVAAYARGAASSDLMLAEMKVDDRSFKESKGVNLSVPQLVHSYRRPQLSFLSPIRQICFAGNPYKDDAVNPMLAVRAAGYTKVFKVLHKHTQGHRPMIRLSLQPLGDAGALGSDDHSDVTFNPWHDRQFGTLDHKGNWGVWDIEEVYERSRKGSGLTMTSNGRVTPGDYRIADGWGRITWGGDLNSVMACDRHNARLFDIRNTASSPDIILPVDRGRSWILDMQRSLTNGGTPDAYVLTSSDVVLVDIRQPGRALLSWPHHRHQDDVTMYLELLHSADVTTALVGSRLNFLTTCYQFSSGTVLDRSPTMLGDAFMLTPPFDQSKSAINMAFLPCSLRTAKGATGPATEYEDNGVNFFAGFAIDKEMRISQRLYSTQEIADTPRGGTAVSSEYIAESEEEEINLDSGTEREFADSQGQPFKSGGSRSHRRTDLSEIYDLVFRQGEKALRTVQDGDTANSVAGYCATLAELLETRAERGNLGISSLIEIRAPPLLFDELSDLETGIEELLSSAKIQDSFETHSLIHDSLSGLLMASSESSGVSIQALYDNLVSTRVTPLHTNIPPQVRLHRERLSRLVATELYLASIGISLKPTPEQLLPPPSQMHCSNGPSQSSPWTSDSGEVRETEHLQRIRAYAHAHTRVTLPEGIGRVLDGWKVSENPEESEFFIDPQEGVPRYWKDRRKFLKGKQRLSRGGRDPASQGSAEVPDVFDGSDSQSQSQAVTMSQVVQGNHGSRKQKKRKTGF